jgi:hypothetical protein
LSLGSPTILNGNKNTHSFNHKSIDFIEDVVRSL